MGMRPQGGVANGFSASGASLFARSISSAMIRSSIRFDPYKLQPPFNPPPPRRRAKNGSPGVKAVEGGQNLALISARSIRISWRFGQAMQAAFFSLCAKASIAGSKPDVRRRGQHQHRGLDVSAKPSAFSLSIRP